MIALAPAKINLALHITGQRADGYHLLESLVVFAKVGDRLTIDAAREDSLKFSGAFGSLLRTDPATNLVLRARDALRDVARARGLICPPVCLHLEKNLPLSSGIGGGSADAAATLKALSELWRLDLNSQELAAIGLTLGADVPMCLCGKPLIASGVGETILPIDWFPELALVLVNPGVGVSTPAIFKALKNKNNSGLAPLSSANGENGAELIKYLSSTRNDLEAAAIALCPQIADVLHTLNSAGASFSRMSGSGATCFGIFENDEKARTAAAIITSTYKSWWAA